MHVPLFFFERQSELRSPRARSAESPVGETPIFGDASNHAERLLLHRHALVCATSLLVAEVAPTL